MDVDVLCFERAVAIAKSLVVVIVDQQFGSANLLPQSLCTKFLSKQIRVVMISVVKLIRGLDALEKYPYLNLDTAREAFKHLY